MNNSKNLEKSLDDCKEKQKDLRKKIKILSTNLSELQSLLIGEKEFQSKLEEEIQIFKSKLGENF